MIIYYAIIQWKIVAQCLCVCLTVCDSGDGLPVCVRLCVCVVPLKAVRTAAAGADGAAGGVFAAPTAGRAAQR